MENWWPENYRLCSNRSIYLSLNLSRFLSVSFLSPRYVIFWQSWWRNDGQRPTDSGSIRSILLSLNLSRFRSVSLSLSLTLCDFRPCWRRADGQRTSDSAQSRGGRSQVCYAKTTFWCCWSKYLSPEISDSFSNCSTLDHMLKFTYRRNPPLWICLSFTHSVTQCQV